MGTIDPLKTTMHARQGVVAAGGVRIVSSADHSIVCEACGCTHRSGLGLVRDWQPTAWFCGPCVAERLDPL